MRRSAILVLLLVLGGNLAAWWALNRPYDAPAWQGIIRGVAYSPYQRDQSPQRNEPGADKRGSYAAGSGAVMGTEPEIRPDMPTRDNIEQV